MAKEIKEMTGRGGSSPIEMIVYLLAGILFLLVVAGLIVAIPDIKRYLRIRQM